MNAMKKLKFTQTVKLIAGGYAEFEGFVFSEKGWRIVVRPYEGDSLGEAIEVDPDDLVSED